MIEDEAWRCIPIKLSEIGGVTGILKMNVVVGNSSNSGGGGSSSASSSSAASSGDWTRNILGLNLGVSFAATNSCFQLSPAPVMRSRSRKLSIGGSSQSRGASKSSESGLKLAEEFEGESRDAAAEGAQQRLDTSEEDQATNGDEKSADVLPKPQPPISFMQVYEAHGNPFHFITESESAELNSSSSSSGSSHGEDSSPEQQSEPVVAKFESVASAAVEFVNFLNQEDEEEQANKASKGRRAQEQEAQQSDSTVVTQTVMRGLGKSVSKYLQLMCLLHPIDEYAHFQDSSSPALEYEVFRQLCQLFDFLYLRGV